uniref:Uncharacterized protein n=2 Tax=Tetraselmis sp. GSL018 TaxID=582737 RepID=A0A061SIS2_9CHLO|mmetsp:Transcript_34685/g.82252  ORF Transcript_34685/g.82252 Transcript_34685/m.82252 type:complete len:235 (-) Transcript_34685:184-888(-)
MLASSQDNESALTNRQSGQLPYCSCEVVEGENRSVDEASAFSRSGICDICGCRRSASFSAVTDEPSRRVVKQGLVLRSTRYALEAWQVAVFVGGASRGVRCGWDGIKTGVALTWSHVTQLTSWGMSWLPELSLAALSIPKLKVPITAGVVVLGVCSTVELLASAVACGATGLLIGSAQGSFAVAAWTAVEASRTARRGFWGVLGALRRLARWWRAARCRAAAPCPAPLPGTGLK